MSPKLEIRPIWMRARSFFNASFQRFFNFAIIFRLFHVDEIDHDKACKIAQTELTSGFVRRLDYLF